MQKKAFSMVELAVALFLVTVAFLPIYSLFSYGNQGAENNVFEVTASNYASDMINFIRDLKPEVLRKGSGFSSNELVLKNDKEAAEFFKSINLTSPTAVEKPYERKITLTDEWHRTWQQKLKDFFIGLFKKRQHIDAMLARVEVAFPKPDKSKGLDKVVLYSLVID